jgi:hypothetical protein
MRTYSNVILPLTIIILYVVHRKRERQQPPTIDPRTLHNETYPPNTPPTAGFGLTAGKGFLLGLVAVPVLFVVIAFVVGMIQGIADRF